MCVCDKGGGKRYGKKSETVKVCTWLRQTIFHGCGCKKKKEINFPIAAEKNHPCMSRHKVISCDVTLFTFIFMRWLRHEMRMMVVVKEDIPKLFFPSILYTHDITSKSINNFIDQNQTNVKWVVRCAILFAPEKFIIPLNKTRHRKSYDKKYWIQYSVRHSDFPCDLILFFWLDLFLKKVIISRYAVRTCVNVRNNKNRIFFFELTLQCQYNSQSENLLALVGVSFLVVLPVMWINRKTRYIHAWFIKYLKHFTIHVLHKKKFGVNNAEKCY